MLTGLGKWLVLKLAVNYSVSTLNAAAGNKDTQQPSRSASIFLGHLPSWRKSKSFFDLINLFSVYCNSGNISFSPSSMMLLVHSNRTLCYEKGLICFFPLQPASPKPFCMFLSLNSPPNDKAAVQELFDQSQSWELFDVPWMSKWIQSLCFVLENVSVRNNSKMGDSTYPVASHRTQPKSLLHTLMYRFPAEASQ